MRNAAILLIGLLSFSSVLFGQASTTGTITGTIKDQSGASIPGVGLTLTNSSNGFSGTGVSDENGVFRFLGVPSVPGYQMKAELAGFSTVNVSDILVRPGGSQRFDLTLTVGQVATEVAVTAEVPIINSESSQVMEALSDNFTKNIPLVRRDFTEIATLFQATQHSASDDSGSFVQFHSRGNPTTSNGYRIDGAQAVWVDGGRIGVRMSKTAIDQMEFIAGGFSAEYGEQPGAIINLVSKSGKNDTFVDYGFVYKPEALTSNITSGLPNQVNKKAKGHTHFEEFSIGGAIKKDRLFYFNAFQYSLDDLGNLVASKTRKSFWFTDHLKISYMSGNDRLDFSYEHDVSMQHNIFFRNAEWSPESEAQQRVTLEFGTVKYTHPSGAHTVFETMSLVHMVPLTIPPESRLYQPGGIYTGPLRSKDFVTVFTRAGNYTTGPYATYGGQASKRWRISQKVVYQNGAHNLRVGGDFSRTWGSNWNRDVARNFTDRRPIGSTLTRTDFVYGRPNYDGNEVAVFIQDGWKLARNVLLDVGFRLDGQSRVHDINNAAPRIGLTIDPTGTGKNRIYANWGFFYEFVPGGRYLFGEATLLNRLYLVNNPDANLNGTDVLLNEFRQVRSPTLAAPLVNSWSVGYDQMLPGKVKVGATYAGNRQHRRFTNLRSPTRDFLNNDGRTNYRGLEFNWRRPFAKGIEISGNYTWSRTLGDTDSAVTLLQLPYRYAYMDWHEPHGANFLGMAQFFGFTITPKFQLNSGRRYSLNSPNVGTAVVFVDKEGKPAGRNIYAAPAHWALDLSISKDIHHEKYKISPVIQFLNLTNRVNVLGVSSNFFSPGLPTNVGDSRQIQLGVDVFFGK